MLESAKLMRCGNCGGGEFNLYKSRDFKALLVAECSHCKSTSDIRAVTKIDIDWGEGRQGILCVMD